MSLFHGVHEVRLFRSNGVAVGYFDNWDAALRAVESEPTQYKAAYFTLNPLRLPEGIQVNPASLHSSANAAGASDIERRVWLLIDCDPPRQAKTNSTAEEKQAAREEAERIREWLRSQGWPEPVLADSGNGWHLLYRIDLPNDDGASELVRGVLARLHRSSLWWTQAITMLQGSANFTVHGRVRANSQKSGLGGVLPSRRQGAARL